MHYGPIIFLFFVGLLIGSVILILTSLIGKGFANKAKNMPFECGVPSISTMTQRIPVRFYLIAILFLIFDVEIVFFFPWALAFQDFLPYGKFIFLEIGFFVLTLLIGYFYILGKDVLEWD